MPTWSVTEILQRTHGALLWGEPQQQVYGVSTDSRTVHAGELFVALQGEHFDGHRFIATALQHGAAAVLLSDAQCVAPQSVTTASAGMLVADTQKALQEFALA